MAGSSPEPWRWAVLIRAGLAGAALALAGLAGGTVLLPGGASSAGAAVVLAALLGALAIGAWASAPAALRPEPGAEPSLRARWAAAAIALALAGLFAVGSEALGDASRLSGAAAAYARVVGLLAVVLGPAYALGLLLPPLLAEAERREPWDELPEHAWGPVRDLALGLVGGAAAMALTAGLLLIPAATPGPVLLGASVVLASMALLPEPGAAEPDEVLLHQAHTPHGTVRVTEVRYPGGREPERRLYLGEEEESGQLAHTGAPTLAYVATAERWLAGDAPAGASYLFLGGGAGTLPRRLLERDPRARATVVELDPEITRAAQRFFGLRPGPRLRVVHGDARAYLDVAREPVDRIYVDVYAGSETVPHSLLTLDSLRAARRLLRPGGVLALNLIGIPTGPEAPRFWSVLRTLQRAFPSVALYLHLGRDFTERQNALVAAAAEPDRDWPPMIGGWERWPRDEWPAVPGATVFRDLAEAPEAGPGWARTDAGPAAHGERAD